MLTRFLKIFCLCSSLLFSNADHLVFNRITIQPTEAELVSIYNPTLETIDLSDYYITDATRTTEGEYYYNINTGADYWSGQYNDFIARFPEDQMVEPNETLILSLHNHEIFSNYYGYSADLALFEDMRNAFEGVTTISFSNAFVNQDMLDDDIEMLMIFKWDGVSDLVQDVDYFIWGSTDEAIDKTGVANYLDDTPIEGQFPHYSHGQDSTYVRVTNNIEGNETQLGGNGITGHDETSENFPNSWNVILSPEIIYGCNNIAACNYDSGATFNDGSCWFANEGCDCSDPQDSISDCAGVCNGSATEDCAGICQGASVLDVCGICDGPGAIYDCGCLDIDIPGSGNPFEDCVDLTIKQVYNQYESNICNNDLSDQGIFISTIGLIIDYEDVTSSNGPRVITIEDPDGYQLDVTIWDWDPTLADNGYHSDISNLIDPYNPTQYYVIVEGLLGSYNCNFQLDASDEGYGGVNINGTITYFDQINTSGDYQSDDSIVKASIDAAPYPFVPSSGERIDFNYSFPDGARVIIRVFDLSGRFITSLVDSYFGSSGTVYMQEDGSDWDGRNHLGQIVSPGTYLIHIEAMNFQTGVTTFDIAPVVVGVSP